MLYDVSGKLRSGADEYDKRQATYGEAYERAGQITQILFPDGVTLKTQKDHMRHQLVAVLIGKLTRYCSLFEKGGHQDSIHDLIVYAAMLEAVDEGPIKDVT